MQHHDGISSDSQERSSWVDDDDCDVEQGRRPTVSIRQQSERRAMNDARRTWFRIEYCLASLCFCRRCTKRHWRIKERKDGIRDVADGTGENDNDEIREEMEGMPGHTQYCVERTRERKKKSWRRWFLSIATCCFTDLLHNAADAEMGGVSKRCLVNGLHWIYRVSIVPLFLIMCLFYYATSIVFAGLIIAAAQAHPSCIRVGTGSIGSFENQFFNAFVLSWNTFATTGYGAVYPALGNQNDDATHCFFVTVICSAESFLGVLYVGFCGAILFGKVVRIHSHAQVTFSDPIVIQYGSVVDQSPFHRRGVDEGEKTNVMKNESDLQTLTRIAPRRKIPLPVLEFRIVNRMFNESGGEIIDANLNVVASIDADDDDSKEQEAVDAEARWKRAGSFVAKALKTRVRQRSFDSCSSQIERNSSGFFPSVSDHPVPAFQSNSRQSSLPPSSNPKFLDRFASINRHGNEDGPSHQSHPEADQEEDPYGRLVGKRIFVKMNIEASSHPFFKRVWLARHVLDETSPILKPSVRRQIRRLGGSWPQKLNTHSGVRESLFFNQILVSLTGIANISASNVYAQKIYDYADCNVGYQFVHMMYRNEEGDIQVNAGLINDVREQKGGGGEPLFSEHKRF